MGGVLHSYYQVKEKEAGRKGCTVHDCTPMTPGSRRAVQTQDRLAVPGAPGERCVGEAQGASGQGSYSVGHWDGGRLSLRVCQNPQKVQQ